jgi:hypothetical protein
LFVAIARYDESPVRSVFRVGGAEDVLSKSLNLNHNLILNPPWSRRKPMKAGHSYVSFSHPEPGARHPPYVLMLANGRARHSVRAVLWLHTFRPMPRGDIGPALFVSIGSWLFDDGS